MNTTVNEAEVEYWRHKAVFWKWACLISFFSLVSVVLCLRWAWPKPDNSIIINSKHLTPGELIDDPYEPIEKLVGGFLTDGTTRYGEVVSVSKEHSALIVKSGLMTYAHPLPMKNQVTFSGSTPWILYQPRGIWIISIGKDEDSLDVNKVLNETERMKKKRDDL